MIQAETDSSKSTSKRPIILSILCWVNWLSFGFSYFWFLFYPTELTGYLQKVGTFYFLLAFGLTYPAILIGAFGLWKMQRWGLYLYSLAILIPIWVVMNIFHGIPKQGMYILGIPTIIAGGFYLKRMH